MKEKHKERILITINEIRHWQYYQEDMQPERAEGAMYSAMTSLKKLKVQALRIDNITLRAMINDIPDEFDYQAEALRAIIKLLPILDEIEDYLHDDDFEAILNVEVQLVPNKSHSQNEITPDKESKIEKTIKNAKQLIENGKTGESLNLLLKELEDIIDEEQINNLILLKSRISQVNNLLNLGQQDFLVVSTEINKITTSTLKEMGRIHRTFFIR